MRVRYTETALAEIDEILSGIAEDNPTAADDVSAAIERAVTYISDHPQGARVVYQGGVQAKMVNPYQYRIFYEVNGEI